MKCHLWPQFLFKKFFFPPSEMYIVGSVTQTNLVYTKIEKKKKTIQGGT